MIDQNNPLGGLPPPYIDYPHRKEQLQQQFQAPAFGLQQVGGVTPFIQGVRETAEFRYVIIKDNGISKQDYLKGYTRPLKFQTEAPTPRQPSFYMQVDSPSDWEVVFTSNRDEAKVFHHPANTPFNAESILLQHRLQFPKQFEDIADFRVAHVSDSEDNEKPFYISKSFFSKFLRKSPHQRWGQQFYDWAKLDRLTNPKSKIYADKIYNAPDEEAKKLVAAIIDHNN